MCHLVRLSPIIFPNMPPFLFIVSPLLGPSTRGFPFLTPSTLSPHDQRGISCIGRLKEKNTTSQVVNSHHASNTTHKSDRRHPSCPYRPHTTVDIPTPSTSLPVCLSTAFLPRLGANSNSPIGAHPPRRDKGNVTGSIFRCRHSQPASETKMAAPFHPAAAENTNRPLFRHGTEKALPCLRHDHQQSKVAERGERSSANIEEHKVVQCSTIANRGRR